MGREQRFKDRSWNLGGEDGQVGTWEMAGIAVLMDIRDELKQLNALLSCPNFTAIPATLRKISRNTAKRSKKKAAR
jgi:hypothetical protein